MTRWLAALLLVAAARAAGAAPPCPERNAFGVCIRKPPPIKAPRPLAPPSASVLATRRVVLRWVPAPRFAHAEVVLCQARACAGKPLARWAGNLGAQQDTGKLAPGTYYWRVRAAKKARGTGPWSPTWQFRVPADEAAGNPAPRPSFDCNGDGLADLAIGGTDARAGWVARGGWPNGGADNQHQVYIGRAAADPMALAVTLQKPEDWGGLGQALAPAGDLNGDGFADLAVGSPLYKGGQVLIYFGGPRCIQPAADVVLEGQTKFGVELRGAGDVDGDGYADLAVADTGVDNIRTPGRVWVVYGAPTNLGSRVTEIVGPDGDASAFGALIATGDLNSDGRLDLAVSAPGPSVNETTDPHRIHIYLGTPTGISVGAQQTLAMPAGSSFGVSGLRFLVRNGDGYPQLAATEVSESAGSLLLYSPAVGGLAAMPERISESARVLASGDVNGDGRADLIGRDARCGLWVRLGGSVAEPTRWPAPATDQDCGDLPIAVPGDVDGDGFDDLAASAPGGRVFLYRGSAAGLSAQPVKIIATPAAANARAFGHALSDG